MAASWYPASSPVRQLNATNRTHEGWRLQTTEERPYISGFRTPVPLHCCHSRKRVNDDQSRTNCHQSMAGAPIEANLPFTATNGLTPLIKPGATGCGKARSIARVPQVPAVVASAFTRSLTSNFWAN